MPEEKTILDKLGVDIGYKTTHVKTVTDEDIRKFAEVSGDFNPIHLKEDYAKKTLFAGRIAHGVYTLSLISAAAAKLPGLPILLSFSGKFLKPVRIGDTVTAMVEVTAARKGIGIVTLKSVCTNQKGEVVVEGETLARLLEMPEQ